MIQFKRVSAYGQRGVFFGERRDCTVRATAIAVGRSYAHIHQIAGKCGRQVRKGMRMHDLGAEIGLKYIETGSLKVSVECGRRTSLYPTLAKVMPLLESGRYVVGRAGHVFAVIDGIIMDDCNQGPTCRVTGIWEVV